MPDIRRITLLTTLKVTRVPCSPIGEFRPRRGLRHLPSLGDLPRLGGVQIHASDRFAGGRIQRLLVVPVDNQVSPIIRAIGTLPSRVLIQRLHLELRYRIFKLHFIVGEI